jgi:hypothetical protein
MAVATLSGDLDESAIHCMNDPILSAVAGSVELESKLFRR